MKGGHYETILFYSCVFTSTSDKERHKGNLADKVMKELAKGKYFYNLASLFPKNPAAETYTESTLAGFKKRIARIKADPRILKHVRVSIA